jgi:F-type H+-transporting ATPase subunit gamma
MGDVLALEGFEGRGRLRKAWVSCQTNFDPRIPDLTCTDYLFEPSKDEVVKSLVPRHLNIQMWRFLLESYASEQAARMTSMEAATNNAGDLIDRLRLEYNKARQAAITTEILEVVSGAEALVE